MPKILYISSFKQLPVAFLIAVACIGFLEYFGHSNLREKYFNHEVDKMLYQIETHQFNAEYLLIGDSVGLQILHQFSGDPRFALLATNQAIEITGQFFITQRYLRKNSRPKAVIFVGLPFFYRNLEQRYTENFVLRTFTQFDEIWTIFKVKFDPSMAFKMFSYKYLQTYRYRLGLQKSLTGFTNSDIYTGVDSASRNAKLGNHSIIRILKEKLPDEKTSYAHFLELLMYLDKQGIDFHYIPAPMEKQFEKYKSTNYRQHQKLITSQLPPLKKQYPRFYYFSELVEHDRKQFRDHVHYTPESLQHGEKYVRDKVNLIKSNY